jgi:hypothetical protein
MKKIILGIILGFFSLTTFGFDLSEVDAIGVNYEEFSYWEYLFYEPITFDFLFGKEDIKINITCLEYVNDSLKFVEYIIDTTIDDDSETLLIFYENIIRINTNGRTGKLINVSRTPIIETTCDYVEQDTIDAYNNGYDQGQLDYTCDYTKQDSIDAFNNGVESVNTDSIYNSGYDDGVKSVDCETKSATINQIDVNVYPNPTTDYVNVELENYDKTEVYSIDGRLLKTEYTKIINFIDLKKGTYILKIYNWDNETTRIKVVYK